MTGIPWWSQIQAARLEFGDRVLRKLVMDLFDPDGSRTNEGEAKGLSTAEKLELLDHVCEHWNPQHPVLLRYWEKRKGQRLEDQESSQAPDDAVEQAYETCKEALRIAAEIIDGAFAGLRDRRSTR